MLKDFRYISSLCKYIKKRQHRKAFYKIPFEDHISEALWYLEGYFLNEMTMTIQQRERTVAKLRSPTCYELLSALDYVHSKVLGNGTQSRYIEQTPPWLQDKPYDVNLDHWFVDQNECFYSTHEVIKDLHAKVKDIHQALKDPKNEDFVYHYTKKPKNVFIDIIALMKTFS